MSTVSIVEIYESMDVYDEVPFYFIFDGDTDIEERLTKNEDWNIVTSSFTDKTKLHCKVKTLNFNNSDNDISSIDLNSILESYVNGEKFDIIKEETLELETLGIQDGILGPDEPN